MSQQDDGSFKMLQNDDEVLEARLSGCPIFRQGDHVEVFNKSLGSQPPGKFIITLIKEDDMVLMGVPK